MCYNCGIFCGDSTYGHELVWLPSHVGIPSNERADQNAKQGAESSQPEVSLPLRRAKSIISTFIDKYTTVAQKTKSYGKPWETLTTVGTIPRHLERANAVARFHLTTGHEFLAVYLHWLGLAAAHSAAMPEWMATTCSNALDLMNTRLTTSSVGTERLGVK
ncbi:uncharacterized protein TNCV_5078361 [Trichonephila clavipes]|nr:uncharacterized protein TNCV_5078361 [Trichonephila clavipes]